MKRILYREHGRWSEPGYQADVSIFDSGGLLGDFKGSTWPNPHDPHEPERQLSDAYGAIAPGIYKARFSRTAHHGEPGFILHNDAFVPTIAPNPNQDGQPHADMIHAHCGQNLLWRGSAACLTHRPDHHHMICAKFEEGELLEIEVLRDVNEVSC